MSYKLYDIILTFFKGDKDKTMLWFVTGNPNLGGISPVHMIMTGRVEKLNMFIVEAMKYNKENSMSKQFNNKSKIGVSWSEPKEITDLRELIDEGLNSGEATPLDIDDIIKGVKGKQEVVRVGSPRLLTNGLSPSELEKKYQQNKEKNMSKKFNKLKGTQLSIPKFRKFDSVIKDKGDYTFGGIVIAVMEKVDIWWGDDGTYTPNTGIFRYAVQNREGLIHIFNASQLEFVEHINSQE